MIEPSLESEERIVPGDSSQLIFQEHVTRYLFAARFAQHSRVLDAACGNGYAAPIFWAAGARSYLGIDISVKAVSTAAARYAVSDTIRFSEDDASRLNSVPDDSIDLAVSFETIEHVPDPEGMLTNIRRVLKPGGKLIVSTPNRSWSRPNDTLSCAPPNPFHLREWSHEEFIDLVSRYFQLGTEYGQFLTTKFKISTKGALMRWGLYSRYRQIKGQAPGNGKSSHPMPAVDPSSWGTVERLTQRQTAQYIILVGVKE